jgi:tetratricopeptide (TPR) repeat protein
MKKIFFLVSCLLGIGAAFGQSNKVVTAFNLMKPEYNELDKAKQAIDDASVHPKTSMEAKTWFYRGQVYYKISQSREEKFTNLDPDPLKQAYLSFVKASELDTKGRYTDDLVFNLTRASADFFNRGSTEYAEKKFKESIESYESSMTIDELPFIHQLDTVLFYNAALAAEGAGMKDKAIDYYKKAIALNYGGADLYHYLAEVYLKNGDTTNALKTYDEGIKIYPNVSALYIAMVNYFLGKKDLPSAFGFVEKAIEKDPTNASLWQFYGRAMEDKDKEKAIEAYKKMIDLEPNNFTGYYNVGTVYFNEGYEANIKAQAIPLNDEAGFKAANDVADDYFNKALPFFEKAYEINKEDSDLLSGLKQIYYRFKMNEKLADVQKRIDALK